MNIFLSTSAGAIASLSYPFYFRKFWFDVLLFTWSSYKSEMLLLLIQVHYLKEFGLTTEEVGRLLAFKPQLMCCSIEKKWEPLLKYLYYLGISRDGMRRMLTIKPMVFCVDLETTIVPKVYCLRVDNSFNLILSASLLFSF